MVKTLIKNKKMGNVINDAHVHIGQFRDLYSSAESVYNFLKSVNVGRFAVSSSTIAEVGYRDSYERILQEMQDIVRIGGDSIDPVLWIEPTMLDNGWLEKFCDSGIKWKCLKVHGYMHSWSDDQINRVIKLAGQMGLPLLFHTGGKPESDAGSYHKFIKANPSQIFILAHSRPVEQTIEIMTDCSNAWADTAFTPIDAIVKMMQKGLIERMMWGTDYPLPNVFYPNIEASKYYNDLVEKVKSVMGPKDWGMLSSVNYYKIFGY